MSSNPAFAFVVNSLLTNNKNAKLLSKAKKETVINDVPQSTDKIEFVNENGNTVQNDTPAVEPNLKTKQSKRKYVSTNRHEIDSVNRVKPRLEDNERERKLATIATKGVVQLFNVVREQQKEIKHKLEEVGPSERKRSKALSEFNEEDLITKVNEKSKDNKLPQKNISNKKWKVLSDDFMTGAKLKDWDKESDSDED